jgi:hypothetical protein
MVRQMGEVETPGRVLVRMVCPECGVQQAAEIEVMAELKTSEELDGTKVSELAPKIKKQKVAHRCHQTTMDDVIVNVTPTK